MSNDSVAQSAHSLLRSGDKAYDEGNYSTSEEQYLKSLEQESSLQGHFNLGNALYQQERYEEAAEAYESAVSKLDNDIDRAKAYHNQGNALFNNNKLKESVEAYKNALRYNSEDEDTRSNLVQAMTQLKMMEAQQQEQQQQQDQDSNEENEDQEQEQEQQEQQDQNQENEEPQNSEEQNDQQAQQDSMQNQSPQDSLSQEQLDSLMQQEVSKEEALRLLQIAEKEEKKLRDRIIRQDANAPRPKKDW